MGTAKGRHLSNHKVLFYNKYMRHTITNMSCVSFTGPLYSYLTHGGMYVYHFTADRLFYKYSNYFADYCLKTLKLFNAQYVPQISQYSMPLEWFQRHEYFFLSN